MADLYIGDPSFKYPVLISSIPLDRDTSSYASGSIAPNTIQIVRWVTTPTNPQLSLWEMRETLRLGSDDAAHEWPDGASLTSNQRSVYKMVENSLLQSDDRANQRVTRIILKNLSADTIPYFCYFKSYSFANAVGGNS